MRRALQQMVRGQVATVKSIPAPVGGWDTESPLANMPRQNAVILDNWIPRAAFCELRRGFVQQVSGFAHPVESLIAYRGSASGDKLFACSDTKIYDVTTSGSLGSAVYASATSARWKATNFANDAGAWAIAVNGVDTPLKYSGSAWSTTAITGTSGSITLVPTMLSDVMVHKRRLFFIEGGTLRVWYLAVNAIAGASGLLDLGLIFSKGGQLVGEGTWTVDGGAGPDDLAVFLTNKGQVAVYQGIDPSDANNWSLIGVYDLAEPIGTRPLMKYGSDLVIITKAGVVPLSQALALDRSQEDRVAITAKIATAFSTAVASYGSNFGWQGMLYSGRGGLAIFNVPTTALTDAVQYVQSIQTGGWCRFTGWPAICFEVANGNLYFGGADTVYRADVGASDDGETIVADMKPAFSVFGSAGQKRATMIRPLMKAPSIVTPALEVLADYREAVPTATPTVITAGDIDPTEDPNAIRYDWTGATAVGYALAPRMRLSLVGTGDTDRIAWSTSGLLLIDGSGDHLLTREDLPLDVDVQIVGFDLMYEAGSAV